jgi:integrase
VKPILLEWRNTFSSNPRKADYAFQVLSAILSWGVHQGLVDRNIILGTPQLYSSNRANSIWTEDEIVRFEEAAPSPEVGFIVRFAALTGARRDDLVKVSWTHVGENSISFATGKSGGRKTVIIPLMPELKALLIKIRTQQTRRYDEVAAAARKKGRPAPPFPLTVLTNTRAQAWTSAGLEHQVIDTKASVGIDRHLHDARGTFATRLCKGGTTDTEIAAILGWEERRVARLRSIYVNGDDVAAAVAERIAANEARSKTPERTPERTSD